MSFIRPPVSRPVVRAPSRPPSPPRTQQQRQPSPQQGRGPQSSSPQRQQAHHRQQPARSSSGWQNSAHNQQSGSQQTSGGGWRNAGGQQGSQTPIRGGWPVQTDPNTGRPLGLRGGSDKPPSYNDATGANAPGKPSYGAATKSQWKPVPGAPGVKIRDSHTHDGTVDLDVRGTKITGASGVTIQGKKYG